MTWWPQNHPFPVNKYAGASVNTRTVAAAHKPVKKEMQIFTSPILIVEEYT